MTPFLAIATEILYSADKRSQATHHTASQLTCQASDTLSLVRDTENALEERVFVDLSSGLQEVMHLSGSLCTLQFLTVEEFLFEHVERFPRLDERFCTLSIPSSEACGRGEWQGYL